MTAEGRPCTFTSLAPPVGSPLQLTALSMIEPILQKLVPPLIGLLRTPTRSSQLFSASRNLHPNAGLFPPRSPRRFYASPTSDPRPPFPSGPQNIHQGSQY